MRGVRIRCDNSCTRRIPLFVARRSADRMRSAAIAIRLPRWEVVLRGVRWRGLAGAVFALLVTAVLIQPPVSNHPAVRAKVDPALSALARALPSRTFPVIVRETRPASTFAEDLV